jgi:tetratricopeptide (TPR) repeat protein
LIETIQTILSDDNITIHLPTETNTDFEKYSGLDLAIEYDLNGTKFLAIILFVDENSDDNFNWLDFVIDKKKQLHAAKCFVISSIAFTELEYKKGLQNFIDLEILENISEQTIIRWTPRFTWIYNYFTNSVDFGFADENDTKVNQETDNILNKELLTNENPDQYIIRHKFSEQIITVRQYIDDLLNQALLGFIQEDTLDKLEVEKELVISLAGPPNYYVNTSKGKKDVLAMAGRFVFHINDYLQYQSLIPSDINSTKINNVKKENYIIKKPTIFISYSWKDYSYADEIDSNFQALGLTLKRDIRETKYRESFKTYMESIRDCDYAIVIISDNFLKSKNCLFEISELTKEKDYRKKILPIIIPGTKIFDPGKRLGYIEYWQNKYSKLKKRAMSVDIEFTKSTIDDISTIRDIAENIGEFISLMADVKHVDYTDLKSSNFRALFDHIGYDTQLIDRELLIIHNTEDENSRDILLDSFILKYPNYYQGYSYKGQLLIKRGKFQQAIFYLSKSIELFGDEPFSYNNRAYCYMQLMNNLSDEEKKERDQMILHDLDKALEIHPNFVDALGNKASMLHSLDSIDRALTINPSYLMGYHIKQIILYLDERYTEALETINEALSINPNFVRGLYDRGRLYIIQKEINKAFEDFKKAIKLDPYFHKAYVELSMIYASQGKTELAIESLEKAKLLGNKWPLVDELLDSYEKAKLLGNKWPLVDELLDSYNDSNPNDNSP